MKVLLTILLGAGASIGFGICYLLVTSGCNNCDAQNECLTNVQYRAYDSTGKVDPAKICGAPAVNDGMLHGDQCGVHYHWSAPSGRCDCDAVVGCSSLTGEYDWKNCVFTRPGQAAADLATPPDLALPMAPDLASCLDITNDATTIHLSAGAGMAPAPTGGSYSDGLYHAMTSTVYGTGLPTGTDLGTFSGTIKISGTTGETIYDSMPLQGAAISFYGRGSFTAASGVVTVALVCSSTGQAQFTFGYSVTSATTFDVMTTMGGYTTVTTYSR